MMEKLSHEEFLYRKNCFDENYKIILEEINIAALKAQNKEDVLFLAATKTVPVEIINYALKNGIKAIGENKVQEFLLKYEEILQNTEKHFIGHLQTNKVKAIVGKVNLIESVDSVKVALEIAKESETQNIVSDILIEVNIGNEDSKSGISTDALDELIFEISEIRGIKVRGLMTIPPICENISKNSAYFAKMRKVFIDIRHKNIDNISMDFLSMGMSDDFKVAIAEGSNIIRIGTALFGKRNY